MAVEEFKKFVMPRKIAQWFRASIQSAFADLGELRRQKKQALVKRRTKLVGAVGFEPTTFSSQSWRATGLRYAPHGCPGPATT